MATLQSRAAVAPRTAAAPVARAPVRSAGVPTRRGPPAPKLQPQEQKNDDDFDIIVHPVTGKPIRISKQEQTKPSESAPQPKEMPVSGNFATSSASPGANGGFVDMTGGRASQSVSQAIAQGNVGGMVPGIQGQLVDFFLKNKT